MEDAINNFASLSVSGLIWTLKRDINKINEKIDNYKYVKINSIHTTDCLV